MSGSQTVVSSGGYFFNPIGVTIESSGSILIVDADAFGGGGGVIRVDSITGIQTTVAYGGRFSDPFGIALDATGNILVVDRETAVPGFGGIIQVDPFTGAQSLVSSGDSLVIPGGIAVVQNPYIEVLIDIKPGSDDNPINLSSRVVPVAVMTTDTFDAATVDAASINVAGAAVRMRGNSGTSGSLQDVDGDGDSDLIVQVLTEQMVLTQGDVEAVLTGMTFDGRTIRGSDKIRVVP